MKRLGLKSKRDLGNSCPCCGPWKLDHLDRSRERQRTREEIRAELLASDDSVGPLIVPTRRPPC